MAIFENQTVGSNPIVIVEITYKKSKLYSHFKNKDKSMALSPWFSYASPIWEIDESQWLNINMIWNIKSLCYDVVSFPTVVEEHYFTFISKKLRTCNSCMRFFPFRYLLSKCRCNSRKTIRLSTRVELWLTNWPLDIFI